MNIREKRIVAANSKKEKLHSALSTLTRLSLEFSFLKSGKDILEFDEWWCSIGDEFGGWWQSVSNAKENVATSLINISIGDEDPDIFIRVVDIEEFPVFELISDLCPPHESEFNDQIYSDTVVIDVGEYLDNTSLTVCTNVKSIAPQNLMLLLDVHELSNDNEHKYITLDSNEICDKESVMLSTNMLHDKSCSKFPSKSKPCKRKCAAVRCDSNSAAMHSFPSLLRNGQISKIELERCRKWIHQSGNVKLLEVPSSSLHRNYFICSSHFDTTQYYNTQRKRLLPDAVPTLNSTPLFSDALNSLPVLKINEHGMLINDDTEEMDSLNLNDFTLISADAVCNSERIDNNSMQADDNNPIAEPHTFIQDVCLDLDELNDDDEHEHITLDSNEICDKEPVMLSTNILL